MGPERSYPRHTRSVEIISLAGGYRGFPAIYSKPYGLEARGLTRTSINRRTCVCDKRSNFLMASLCKPRRLLLRHKSIFARLKLTGALPKLGREVTDEQYAKAATLSALRQLSRRKATSPLSDASGAVERPLHSAIPMQGMRCSILEDTTTLTISR